MKHWRRAFLLLTAAICCLSGNALTESDTLTLPKGSERIEGEAFSGDSSIQQAAIPEGAASIDSRAFSDSGIQENSLPESPSDNAFEDSAVNAPDGSQAQERAESHGPVKDDPQPETGAFKYVHDPRENPRAMVDIVENPNAVYGFSPSPDSDRLAPYADYDWTDPKFVAKAQQTRRDYHKSMDPLLDILYRMRAENASIEEMARAVSAERNRLRIESYKDDPEGLAKLRESNLKTYGNEDGPTPESLFEKYGSWTEVLQKSFATNMGMDACCGLYDEMYPLYIELGYVE